MSVARVVVKTFAFLYMRMQKYKECKITRWKNYNLRWIFCNNRYFLPFILSYMPMGPHRISE